jgi:hypothetical protein
MLPNRMMPDGSEVDARDKERERRERGERKREREREREREGEREKQNEKASINLSGFTNQRIHANREPFRSLGLDKLYGAHICIPHVTSCSRTNSGLTRTHSRGRDLTRNS